MPITLIPFAAEHVANPDRLIQPQEADLILARSGVLRYWTVYDGDICVGVVGPVSAPPHNGPSTTKLYEPTDAQITIGEAKKCDLRRERKTR